MSSRISSTTLNIDKAQITSNGTTINLPLGSEVNGVAINAGNTNINTSTQFTFSEPTNTTQSILYTSPVTISDKRIQLVYPMLQLAIRHVIREVLALIILELGFKPYMPIQVETTTRF